MPPLSYKARATRIAYAETTPHELV